MRIRALLIACLLAAASLLIATPAQAAPATVYIYKVYFDSPGSDRGSNSSLNAEYVVIRNGDNVSHSISGWTVRDKAGHVYKFGNLRLGAGKQAIIHTGKGTSYHQRQYAPLLGSGVVCLEQHRGQGDPATRGRLTQGHLLLQRRRQRQVLLKASKPRCRNHPATSIRHPATLIMSTNKIFFL